MTRTNYAGGSTAWPTLWPIKSCISPGWRDHRTQWESRPALGRHADQDLNSRLTFRQSLYCRRARAAGLAHDRAQRGPIDTHAAARCSRFAHLRLLVGRPRPTIAILPTLVFFL